MFCTASVEFGEAPAAVAGAAGLVPVALGAAWEGAI